MTHKEKLNKFKELKEEILAIAIPSSNPDNFTDLEDSLERVEKDLEII